MKIVPHLHSFKHRLLLLAGLLTACYAMQPAPTFAGGITWEIYDLVPGSSVEDLLESGALNRSPDAVRVLRDRFDTSTFGNTSDHGDDYGSRIRGYIQAPTGGNYRFFLRSDDASQLSLSTASGAEAAQVIAEERESGAPLFDGSRIEERSSDPIPLVIGTSYFLEVLHKESTGSDYVQVGWERPDGIREIVPGAFLLPWAPDATTPRIVDPPTDQTVTQGTVLLVSTLVEVQQPATFQWYKDEQPVSDQQGQALWIREATLGDSGTYRLTVTSASGVSVSSANISVMVEPDRTPPAVVFADLDIKGARLEVRFSKQVTAESAIPPNSLSLNLGLVLDSPILSPDRRTLTASVTGLAEGQQGIELVVNGIVDDFGNVATTTPFPVTLLFREGFNQGPGFFTAERNSQTNGNAVGFSNSVNAGGPPGELGGRLTRSTTDNPVYIADASLGGAVSQTQRIVLRGRYHIRNAGANGQAYFGYMQDLNDVRTSGLLGLRLNEPNSATRPNYRGLLVVNGTESPIFPVPPDDILDIDLSYDPATGVLAGRVGQQEVSVTGTPGSATYQALLLGAWGLSSANPAQASLVYVDDLVYSNGSVRLVDDPDPPALLVSLVNPASGALLASGLAAPLAVEIYSVSETVARVEYLVSSNGGQAATVAVAEVTPFSTVWIPADPGPATVVARVITATGATFNTDPVSVQVVVPQPLIVVNESFDENFGRLSASKRNGEGGNLLAHATETLAGGSSGELSGTLARTTLANTFWVGDTNLGGSLYPAYQSISLSGRLWLSNLGANGSIFIGYVNRENLNQRLGLGINEPSGDPTGPFRSSFLNPAGGGTANVVLPQETPIEFELNWNHTARTISGTLHGVEVSFTATTDPSIALDTLVVGAWGANSDQPEAQVRLALDDLTYHILAPSAQSPRLDITRIDQGVRIGWTGLGFTPQSRSGFVPASPWVDASEPVIQEGETHFIIIQPGADQRFWQLIRR